jgi:ribosomal protein S18 acetylase RimI-like enzyme
MYEIVRFGQSPAAPARHLAALHAELLPTSPVAKLGTRFLERFYYSVLPSAGIIFGAVARVDGAAAGFAAATDDSANFARNALRGRQLAAAWAAASSLLVTPGRIATAIEVFRLALARTSIDRCEPQGEILSLGVREQYRGSRFVAESGLQIANDLAEDAIDCLRTKGCQHVRALVDADNLAARFFYSGLGWTLAHSNVAGWRARVVEYEYEL